MIQTFHRAVVARKQALVPSASNVNLLVNYTSPTAGSLVTTANIAAAEVGGIGGSYTYIFKATHPGGTLRDTTIEDESVTRFWPLSCAGNTHQTTGKVVQFNMTAHPGIWEGLLRTLPAGHPNATLTMLVKFNVDAGTAGLDFAHINGDSGAYTTEQFRDNGSGPLISCESNSSGTVRGRAVTAPSGWSIATARYNSTGNLAEALLWNNTTGVLVLACQSPSANTGQDVASWDFSDYLTSLGGTFRVALPAIDLTGVLFVEGTVPAPTNVVAFSTGTASAPQATVLFQSPCQVFKVERATDGGSFSTLDASWDMHTDGADLLQYVDSTVAAGHAYQYRISPVVGGTVYSSATSNSLSVEATTIPTTNLQVWLKADAIAAYDGTAVASWADKSGNGNAATQAADSLKPLLKWSIISGKPVVRFDGTNDMLTGSLSISGGNTTAFVVVAVNSGTPSYGRILNCGTVGTADQNNAASGIHFLRESTNATVRGFRNNAAMDGNAISYATFTVLSSRYNGSTHALWKDGAAGSLGPIASTGSFSATAYRISENLLEDGSVLNGDVAEVIIYNASLSDADRQAVEDYLGAKYGITITH